mgnify:FL=1
MCSCDTYASVRPQLLSCPAGHGRRCRVVDGATAPVLFAKETMNKFVSIRLTEEEKKEIERKADACCLTRSQYIRQTALGIVPRSKLDHQAVHALAKLNGDIGRVGGLLKLWLTRNEDADLHHSLDVREIVKEISFVKLAILEAIEKI